MKTLFKDGPTTRKQLRDNKRMVLEKFEARMLDRSNPFPCIPATIGFSLNQLRYGFIGDPSRLSTVSELANLLRDYTEKSNEFGDYTSLIVFFQLSEETKKTCSVEDYEQLFWHILNQLASIDKLDWPKDIPVKPDHPIWEFCFHGERYFMFCATPAHKNRQSRHFDTMLLAITPRWVLQTFNKSEHRATKIKERIRKRLKAFDSIEVHPDLNSYGEDDNYEWKQYFLHDDDTTIPKCPFHRLLISHYEN
ncbi:YqcI/YcgG family protein [Ornithinibacillus scapharcae]|uniref:YqcI/YcgG family protein n=1 Tax=Ornithinibacillus scapharcae TaxID=1147159 RepID=UPI0002F25C6F|nr:YqcI/YcgG family protein [Ornithinibacillus scapharcae]